jgi:hypothetical protein
VPEIDNSERLIASAYTSLTILGGTILAISLALGYLRFGREPGLGHDPVGRGGANLLHSLLLRWRGAASAMLVAGIVGMAGDLTQQPPASTLIISLVAAVGTALFMIFVPQTLNQLNAQALELQPEVGLLCIVRETIPATGGGFGKVRARKGAHVAEFVAESVSGELGEGFRVRIVSVLADGRVTVTGEAEGEWAFIPTSEKL